MEKSIIVEEQYPYSPEEVWEALTDRSQIGEWLMDNNFQAVVGSEFEFYWAKNDPSKGVTRGKVLELVKPKKLSYTWDWGTNGTVVTFFLEPTAGGTKLRLEHTGFVDGKDEQVFQGASAGWKDKLKKLPLAIANRQSAVS